MQAANSNSFTSPTWFFLASEVRSGSTYVAELISYSLNATLGYELWGLGREHLRDLNDHSTSADITDQVSSLWLTPQNARSSKIMCAQLSVINRWARKDTDLQKLVFGDDARWIVVRRRDKIRQAVSLALARKSGIFHNYDASSVEQEVEVTESDVEDALRAIILSDEYLRAFSKVPNTCVEVFYEDVLKNPKATLGKALTDIGLLRQPGDLQLEKAKLIPGHQRQKSDVENAFTQWLLENHHPIIEGEPSQDDVPGISRDRWMQISIRRNHLAAIINGDDDDPLVFHINQVSAQL